MITTPDAFIARWRASGAAERANYQLFLSELCDLLNVERPRPQTPDEAANAYVFEKPVPLPHGATGFIDLYRRGCFVLEAKQGSQSTESASSDAGDLLGAGEPGGGGAGEKQRRKRGTAVRGTAGWDTAFEKARQQAQTYARGLPPAEIDGGRPPFLIVVDVGATIALYSEFTRSGGAYQPFPDPAHYRLTLDDLRDEHARALLRGVWTEPMALDPARRSARVTRDIAARLAELARSLERRHDPDAVAHFLMRCLFTMFAEDVELLPGRAFTHLLDELRRDPDVFQPMVEDLWRTMNSGGFSVILRRAIPRFNGGLFAQGDALPLTAPQIGLLIEAARADWRDVEPAIFGTLLERALDPVERHKLGAHYTPRAYVERLVRPAIIEPLRAEWESVQAAAAQAAEAGDAKRAVAEVEEFLRRLAHVRVLDPACGSGNFLYVTLELMKRLEGEALNTLRDLGGAPRLEMEGFTVTPQQFLGIEVNPRAAAIAELVLWIGYLQWHLRTRGGVRPAQPIIRDFHNIEQRDAVLAWDATEPLTDAAGRPVTRWDGRATRPHPVTGEAVPDETARVPVLRYLNPRPAEWPAADFVVGNPPFIGKKRIRLTLGDGYVSALRNVYADAVPDSCDYVMYWWHHAASLLSSGKIDRFGLITTNSIKQPFNSRLVERHMTSDSPLSLIYAVPDHPWVDSADGAAVRIAITVAVRGQALQGILDSVVVEEGEEHTVLQSSQGIIHSDLTVGLDTSKVTLLQANLGLSSVGIQLNGTGFVVDDKDATKLGLGRIDSRRIRPIKNGRDISQVDRGNYVIDVDDLDLESLRKQYPDILQWIIQRVKPERDHNSDKNFRTYWWRFGRPRPEYRSSIDGLERYIITPITAKHRFFVFAPTIVLVDSTSVAIALNDAYLLGVLSSFVHNIWALTVGTRLGVGNDPRYNKSRCFETFPFPDATDAQQARIRDLAEQLDAHRKRQQAQHPRLTLTELYNVLEKLRAGQPLNDADRRVHEQGLVAVLRQLHDELDAAVLEAYGWGDLLQAGESSALVARHSSLVAPTILDRLVALNAERAAEEARGLVRWLRPDYQMARASAAGPAQPALLDEPVETFRRNVSTPTPDAGPPWPDGLAARAAAVRAALAALDRPATPRDLAATFAGKPDKRHVDAVAELLQTLVALGQAREAGEGAYVG